jgi:hypothetical protein
MDEFDKITNHFTKLRESVKRDGIHHPISAVSGPLRNSATGMTVAEGQKQSLPLKFQTDTSRLIYTQPFGGSRLIVAAELGIDTIPAVVHDYENLFPDCEEVNHSNFRNWFSGHFVSADAPPYVRTTKHSHMDSNDKYQSFNVATKRAQQQAAIIACERTKEKYG